MNLFKLHIPALPDTGEAFLSSRYENVQEECISVSEQFLRIISKQPPGSMRTAVRFTFDPHKQWQRRTKIDLFLAADQNNEKFARELLLSGPLAPLYVNARNRISPQVDKVSSCCLPENLDHVSEIIRFEEALTSDERKRDGSNIYYNNDYIPHTYWSIFPFEPRDDNRWMKLDQALSSCKSTVVIEIIAEPAGLTELRESHYEWITQLMKINAYGSEPDPDNPTDMSLLEDYSPYKDLRYKDHYADELLREHEAFHETLRSPQLKFAIRCWTDNKEELRLITPVVGESCFLEGRYHMIFADQKETIKMLHKSSNSLAVCDNLINDQLWDLIEKNDPETMLPVFKTFSHQASVNELLSAFRLPVTNPDSLPLTMQKQTEFRAESTTNVRKDKLILIGDDVELTGGVPRGYGNDVNSMFGDNSTYPIHTLDLQLLKKHMFICGVPGSGKTTAVFNLLVQLQLYEIPFLVLESAKTEYRILKKLKHHTDSVLQSLGKSIRIYTPGNENVSPFRFNPMFIPEGITVDEHMNNLLSSFQAGMDLPEDTPLPALLGWALEKVYDNYDSDNPPYLSDLVNKIRELMDSNELGYDQEIKSNLKTAIEVRLSPLVSTKRSIGKIFSRDDIQFDLDEVMMMPCIIEMDALSTEQANLLSLFLLTSMREWIKVNRPSGSDLKHVTVLEEAHNVVGNIPESADSADPRKKAADYITRMLAELRALGEGMIIADQLPTAVADSVIKNTGTKLSHRLTSKDDRETIGFTTLLSATDLEDLTRLRPGEASFYAEGMYKPRTVRCINSNAFLGFTNDEKYPPSNNGLFELLETEDWFYIVLHKDTAVELARIEQQLDLINSILSEAEKILKEKNVPDHKIIQSYNDLKEADAELVNIKNYLSIFIKKGEQGIFTQSLIEKIEELSDLLIKLGKKTNALFDDFVKFVHVLKKKRKT